LTEKGLSPFKIYSLVGCSSASLLTPGQAQLERLKALVLDGVTSRETKRAYATALDDFLRWYASAPRGGFTKATVNAYRSQLEERGLSSASINIRLSAVRKLATEAADNGLLPPHVAAGIARVKGARRLGVRTGNGLTLAQAEQLITLPDVSTLKGKRDRALLGLLIGCGLRRKEIAELECERIQQRDARWAIVDLTGKGGRLRTVPMPAWSRSLIDAWTAAAGISSGRIFRPINKGDRISGSSMTPQSVFETVKNYDDRIGNNIAPHDLRRYAESRTMPNALFGGAPAGRRQQTIRHSPEGPGRKAMLGRCKLSLIPIFSTGFAWGHWPLISTPT
jgi:site-specific recombinase XerD